MDSRKRTAIGRTPPASHEYQHDQKMPYLSEDQRHVALDDPSMVPKGTMTPASRRGQMPLSSPKENVIASLEHGPEAYTPLQRWERESFREQPWHGIARELITDEWSGDYPSSYQEIAAERAAP